MRAELTKLTRLRATVANPPLIRPRAEPRPPSPKGEGILRGSLFRIPAHTSVAAGVHGQGLVKAVLREVGEKRRREVELRVGALPQQEVGEIGRAHV